MFNPGMLELNLLTGLITGIVQALVVRASFKSKELSLLIIIGAIFGSFLTNAMAFTTNPKVGNYILIDVFWKFLWQPLGAGTPSSGNFAALALIPLTMVLVQIVGSIVGGLIGLRIWITFFRF